MRAFSGGCGVTLRGRVPREEDAPRVLVALPDRRRVVAEPRAEWLEQTRESWAAYWTSDAAELVIESDVPALRRLFDLLDERERTLSAFRSERVSVGSKGQPVISPLGKHLLSLDAAILALEDRFGLSMLARLRLGVKLGEAHRSLSELNRRLADAETEDRPDPRLGA